MVRRTLGQLLRSLGAVHKGQSVLDVASADRMNALSEAIQLLTRGDNIVAGNNIRKQSGDGYVMLTADVSTKVRGQSVSVPEETPFQVVSRINPDTGALELGVISNSHLFNSEDRDIYEEDNSDWGLLDDDRVIGWFAAGSPGDKIWLQIELDSDQAIISIDVLSSSVGAGFWDTYPNPIEINDDDPNDVYQQFFHQAIAEITDPEQDPRPGLILTIPGTDPAQQIQVTQLLFEDLEMTTAHTTQDSKYPDVPLLVAIPWRTLPATTTDGNADPINTVPSPGGGDDPMTPWAFGPPAFQIVSTPFQVVKTPQNGSNAIGVISNSHLFNSESRDDYEEPNDDWGLLSDDQTTGFFGVPSVGGKIWLQIELNPDDQSIIAVDVMSGGAWSQYPDPVIINTDNPENPYQQYFMQIIAEVTDPEQDPRPGFQIGDPGSEVQVTQLLFNNLMMTTARTTSDADEAGLPLLVAVPWGTFPGTDTSGNADVIPPESDLMTPWQFGTEETLNDYNFELFNASEPGVAKVLILDGVIYGPNNDSGVDPAGMPSNDTYVLEVSDGDEIWVELDWSSTDPPIILTASLNNGESTPDDEEETTYVTIGNVSVDYSGDVPIVSCRNEVCGDIVIQLPPQPFTGNFVLFSKDGDLIWAEVCDSTCGAS